MPRKNRRAPFEHQPPAAARPRSAPPPWAVVDGYDVRQVAGEKEYRCPGCDHVVRPGSWHLVVVPMIRKSQILQRQIQHLRRTRDLLLPRLLSGQVELPKVEVSA